MTNERNIKLSNQALELIIEGLYDLEDSRKNEIEKNKRLGRGLFCLEKDLDKIECLIQELEVIKKMTIIEIKELKEYLTNIIKDFGNITTDMLEGDYMRQVGYRGCAVDVLKFIEKVKDA